MGHLQRDRGMPIGELARHLSVTPGSMTVALARLERAGYVERMGSPEDRRVRPVRLTELGLQVQREHAGFDHARVRALLQRLRPRERTRALAGLALLAHAARGMTRGWNRPKARKGRRLP